MLDLKLQPSPISPRLQEPDSPLDPESEANFAAEFLGAIRQATADVATVSQPEAKRVEAPGVVGESPEDLPAARGEKSNRPPLAVPKGGSEGNVDPAMLQAFQSMQTRFVAATSGDSSVGAKSSASLQAGPGLKPGITQNQLVNVRTAGAMGGAKPWDSSWVFQPGDKSNLELKGLLDSAPPMQDPGGPSGAIDLNALLGMRPVEANLAQIQAQTQIHGQGQPTAGDAQSLNESSDSGAGIPAQLLFQMGGEIIEDSGMKAPQSRATQFSGGDFIETLNLAKGSQAPAQNPFKEALSGMSPGKTGRSGLVEERIGISQPTLRSKAKLSDGLKGEAASDFTTADPAILGGAALNSSPNSSGSSTGANVATLTGHVTTGAMAQPRLSSESLTDVTSQIRSFTQGGKGMGEIRIRLKPENLGELHLKIVTEGNQVGLQIQASDEHARKVIEESLGHLKESLSSQNLNLSRFDVSIGQPVAQAGTDTNLNQNFDGRQSQGFDLGQGRDFSRGGGGGGSTRFDADGGSGQGLSSRPGSMGGASLSAQAARSSLGGINARLDVMA